MPRPPTSRTGSAARRSVVLLTHDSLQFLAPRFVAMRDALQGHAGRRPSSPTSRPPRSTRRAASRRCARSSWRIPTVDVVLGADTVVLGALAALRAAGKARPDQFLGGIDGEPEAVAEIKQGGPYKASISLTSPVFGYAMGQHAADWLEGKSIPQAMDILPIALTAANIAHYEADLADPGAVYADPARRDAISNVRQHLLRHARPVREFSLVVGTALNAL